MIKPRYCRVMETWLSLESGPGEPAFNMALDEALLSSASAIAHPLLRFYGWTEPAASFGYFQNIGDVEQSTQLRPLMRRPTAGGVVPHDADWTYSVAIPAGTEWHRMKAETSYRRMHEWVRRAFAELKVESELATEARRPAPGQCFEGYEIHDVLWRGRKIAGAAQRRTKTGLLIQGSIQPPPLRLDRDEWQRAMYRAWLADWRDWKPDAQIENLCRELMETKHSRREYHRKR